MNRFLIFTSILAISLQLSSCRHKQRDGSQEKQPPLTFAAEAGLAQGIPPPILDSATVSIIASDSTSDAIAILEVTDLIRGKRFFSVDWKGKRIAPLGFVTTSEAKSSSRIQVSYNRVVAFARAGSDGVERLFVRTADSTHEVKTPFADSWLTGGSDQFPAFALSPDGRQIVATAFSDFRLLDTAHGTLFTKILISSMVLGESEFAPPRIDTVVTEWYNADNSFRRILRTWEDHRPNSILLQDFNPGQLSSVTRHLWSYDVGSRSYTLITNEIQIYLASSKNGRFILSTNNDESCCGGVNYTDNLLILQDLQTGHSSVIYDEWARFHNQKRPEEHTPKAACFSPDGMNIAATIRHFYEPGGRSLGTEPNDDASGEVSANLQVFVFRIDGSIVDTLTDREVVGWLDDRNLLVAPRTEQFTGVEWKVSHGAPYVFDIKASEEHPLLRSDTSATSATNVRCINIQSRRPQNK